MMNALIDPQLAQAIEKESIRQEQHIELIASENYVSNAVMKAQGSVLTNKYAEGYPGKRYYGGCEFVDEVEQLAIQRACQLFNVSYANVQPHSGSQANSAVMMALINPGDTILGMALPAGGHLTHGSKVNFSGKIYHSESYGVNDKTGLIDYDELSDIAHTVKPKLLIAGFSAYSRVLDFKKFREIADSVGAFLMADIAHVAGLIATGLYPSPFPYAHVATSTTHKTLRGPRGGIILSNESEEFTKKFNSSIFPGSQGGPLMHVIAAKAVSFYEALQSDFKKYQQQVLLNAKTMADVLISRGHQIVSGGTDNHLLLVNLVNKNITGKDAEAKLGLANITVNKNTVPNDPASPFVTSGLRLGTPAITTRGFKEKEVILISNWIADLLDDPNNESLIEKTKHDVIALCKNFPVYRTE